MSEILFLGRRPTIGRMVVMLCVVAIVLIATGASGERLLAEDKQGDGADAKPPKQSTQAIEVFVDLSLGLCDEQAAKKRMEIINPKNLKAALREEIDGLKRDLVGIRQVTGNQFVALTRRMEIISSGQSIKPIGVSSKRAYLEVNIFLTSKHRYVAVVTTELAELPDEVVKKLKT